MNDDYALPLRRAVLTALKRDAALALLVPAASIYPGTVPAARTYPFIRYGAATAAPFEMSGLKASTIRFAIQAFTQGVKNTAGALTVTAEDHAHLIGSAIKRALNGTTIAIEGGLHARIEWVLSLPSLDGDDTAAWTSKVTLDADISG